MIRRQSENQGKPRAVPQAPHPAEVVVRLKSRAQEAGFHVPPNVILGEFSVPRPNPDSIISRTGKNSPNRPFALAVAYLLASEDRARAVQRLIGADASGAEGAALVLLAVSPDATAEERLRLVEALAQGTFKSLARFLRSSPPEGGNLAPPLSNKEFRHLFNKLPIKGRQLTLGQRCLPDLLVSVLDRDEKTQEAALTYLEKVSLEAKRLATPTVLAWYKQVTAASNDGSQSSGIAFRLEKLIVAAGGNAAAQLLCHRWERTGNNEVPRDSLERSPKAGTLQGVEDKVLLELAQRLVDSVAKDEPLWWTNLVEASETSEAANQIIQLWNTAHGRAWLGTASVAVPQSSREGVTALRNWRPFFRLVAERNAAASLAQEAKETPKKVVEGIMKPLSLAVGSKGKVNPVVGCLEELWEEPSFSPEFLPLVEAWLLIRYPSKSGNRWPEKVWNAWIKVLEPSSDAGFEALVTMIGRLAGPTYYAGVVEQAASALLDVLPERRNHDKALDATQRNGLLEALRPHAARPGAAKNLLGALRAKEQPASR